MPQKSIEKILLEDLKIDPYYLKSSIKVKKLSITADGDIIDNNEATIQFVNDIFSQRNTQVKEWFLTVRPTCEFSIEIYHPDNDEKFIEIISSCMQTYVYSNTSLPIHYKDYIIIYKSTDESLNEKLIRLDISESLLTYLKSKNLIGRVNYRIN